MKSPIVLFAIVVALGCSNKSSDSSNGEGESEAPSADSETITLEKMDNLKVDVAKGTEPGMMGPELAVISMSESFTVSPDRGDGPQTIKDGKKYATETYQATKIADVKVEGGWGFTFEMPAGDKTHYGLYTRREIGGKAYICKTTVGFKQLRDGALRACKSLRK